MSASVIGGDGKEQPAPFLPVTNGVTPFADLCAHICARVDNFLGDDLPTDRLRSTQEHTRTSLDVIAEALDRYRSAVHSLVLFP